MNFGCVTLSTINYTLLAKYFRMYAHIIYIFGEFDRLQSGRPADARKADRKCANRHPSIVFIPCENVGKFGWVVVWLAIRCHCLRLMNLFTDMIVRTHCPIVHCVCTAPSNMRLSNNFPHYSIFRRVHRPLARIMICVFILVLFLLRLASMKLRKLSVITCKYGIRMRRTEIEHHAPRQHSGNTFGFGLFGR